MGKSRPAGRRSGGPRARGFPSSRSFLCGKISNVILGSYRRKDEAIWPPQDQHAQALTTNRENVHSHNLRARTRMMCSVILASRSSILSPCWDRTTPVRDTKLLTPRSLTPEKSIFWRTNPTRRSLFITRPARDKPPWAWRVEPSTAAGKGRPRMTRRWVSPWLMKLTTCVRRQQYQRKKLTARPSARANYPLRGRA